MISFFAVTTLEDTIWENVKRGGNVTSCNIVSERDSF